MLKYSVSGIRGIIGESMTPEVALRFSAAFGNILGGGSVVVGRDTRPSGEGLSAAVVSGLLGTGCDVIDIGVVPTPTALLMRRQLDSNGAVIVTASHNPGEWNALKLVGPDGTFIHGKLSSQLYNRYTSGEITWNRWDKPGVYSKMDGVTPHVEAVLDLPLVDVDRIRAKNFKVALDCVNGAGSDAAQTMLEQLGCEVFCINCEKSGKFTRGPEPVAANLGDLEAAVSERGADIGFALDPDADRLSIVSERGHALGEEMTLPLVVDLVLSHNEGPVVVNLSTSMVSEDIARARGVPFHRTPVGEVNVTLVMNDTDAVIGGEGNGGVMYPRLHPSRDGICGIALILQQMTEKGDPLSKIIRGYPEYHIVKRKVEVSEGEAERILEEIGKNTSGEVNCDDGLRISGQGFWVHLRPSNTEPVVRVIAEAKTAREASRRAGDLEQKIVELLKQ